MKLIYFSTILLIFVTFTTATFANKTSVEITSVKSVNKGGEVTITINVKHSGNSKMHYTDWVYLKINGKEVKRWEYTKDKLPESEEFILTYTVKAAEALKVEAEGHCNLHGSKGISSTNVTIEK